MDAMNRTMGVKETQPFWKARLIAMLMTVSKAAILIVAFVTTLAWPQIMRLAGLTQRLTVLATLLHGIIVFLTILMSFALVHHFAPMPTSAGNGSRREVCLVRWFFYV
jgi:membrane protein